MSEETTNIKLPHMSTNQAQKETTYNEAIDKVDFFVARKILAFVSALPSSPSEGDGYILTTNNNIAHYLNGAWEYYAPFKGARVLNTEDNNEYIFIDAWKAYADSTSGAKAVEAAKEAAASEANAKASEAGAATSANTAATAANTATTNAEEASTSAISAKADAAACQTIRESLSKVFVYKGTVATYDDLPTSGQTVGDTYNVSAADATHGINAGDNVAWGDNGTWDNLSGTVDLSAYAKLNSPVFSGTPTAPTAETNKADLQIATTQFVDNALSARAPKALAYTWAQIQAKIQAGNFSGITVGDYKDITLSDGNIMRMVVAGINTYTGSGYGTGADGGIPNHIDFISRDCYPTTYVFNSTDNNNGNASEANPFIASALYAWLNSTVYSYLPSDAKAVIGNKSCLMPTRYAAGSALTDDNSWAWKTPGPLWLPNEKEVFGAAVWGNRTLGAGGGGCNLQYGVFQKYPEQLVKHVSHGSTGRATWWLASAGAGSSAFVCLVTGDGRCGNPTATYAGIYVPLCFRVI